MGTYMYARIDNNAELVVALLLAELVDLAGLDVDTVDLDTEELGQDAELDTSPPHASQQAATIVGGT